MKLTFLGAAHEVTGSCTLLEACGRKILVDCGMEQGADIYENCELPVNPGEIDAVFLTHAHIDHSGKIPKLSADGFKGKIYTTDATSQLCSIMLRDSAHIQEFEAQWRNRKAKRSGKTPYVPMYTMDDAVNALESFMPCSYNEHYEIFDGIKIRFIDAGHLLGSASIEIKITENGITKTVLFSGDLGNIDRPLIRNPQKPEAADYVIIESTYGNRLHEKRKDYKTQLAKIIQDTLDRSGNVVIPSFAVGRTQELLFLIREIKEDGLVKNHDGFQVFIDSPLAIEATKIYDGGLMDYYDDETLALIEKGVRVLDFDGLHVAITSDESVAINSDPTPKIIISASGMCEAGRIRHHLKHNLWRSDSTVLFVGYQAVGTLGSSIVGGAESCKLFGEEIQINAHIEQMDGISGHADKNMLLDWLSALKNTPEAVFVNHGADEVCDEFAEEITSTLGFKAVAPFNGASFDLATGECLDEGSRIKIIKKNDFAQKTSAAFERLLAAAKRLLQVIEHNRGGTNKDLKKFEDEINKLSDKWDR